MWRTISVFFNFDKFREINARFRRGAVERTPGVRAVLFALKIYVTVFMALLAYKFYHIVSGGKL